MSASAEFNNDLISLIRKHYPKAIQGDIQQNAECANAMAIALGGLVAFAYSLNGEVAGRSTMATIVTVITKHAASISEKAALRLRQDLRNLLN